VNINVRCIEPLIDHVLIGEAFGEFLENNGGVLGKVVIEMEADPPLTFLERISSAAQILVFGYTIDPVPKGSRS
jgi:hypothetical protein